MKFSLSNVDPLITISTAEMLKISQEITREFAPSLSPAQTNNIVYTENFSPQEMLHISETISLDFAPKISNNANQLMLLPVDPNNIYAYWNLNKDDSYHMAKNDPIHQHLTLRIYSTSPSDTKQYKTADWHDIIVDNSKSKQYIPLPVSYQQNSCYASLGKHEENNNLIPLASSDIVAFPFGKSAQHDEQEDTTLLFSNNGFVKNHQEKVNLLNKSSSGQRIN